ncbi:MAG TPA: BACON domain-containing carbohydrate-binding protein [Bryobacterales bacterium]|nr:BACON domain-containing carbohydrate-binding protein [Bryobacterales bacterium]
MKFTECFGTSAPFSRYTVGRRALHRYFHMLVLFFAGAAACLAAGSGTTADDTACMQGGFKLITFGNTPVIGKAGASFNVFFDSAGFEGNSFDSALRSAMSSWSSVSASAWRYNFSGYTAAGASPNDQQMEIIKGGMSFPSGVLATTLVGALVSTGQITDSDTFFNPAYSLSTSPGPNDFDFQSVALHEMGHGLGLAHNDGCNPQPTVMQSAIAPGEQRRNLFSPELAGVTYLYPGSGGGGLGVSPSSLIFTGAAGGASPAPQTLLVSAPQGAAWSAAVATSSGGNWLSVSPQSGAGPATLTVNVAAASLDAGFYAGQITVSGGGSSSAVSVSLNLAGIGASPSSLTFTATVGGAQPPPQGINLSGAPGAAWTAATSTADGGNWLSISSSAGYLPATVLVSVSTAGLAASAYTGSITISSGGASGQVSVQLAVSSEAPLVVSPAQLSLSGAAGSAAPVCAPASIRGSGSASLDWSASLGASWLSIQPASGRTPASISICATPGSLPAGNYSANVSITSAAPNSPVNIAVSFSVTASVTVSSGGVVNGASFTGGQPIAAGEILSIFGANLASQTASAAGFPLPTALADCRVQIAGVPAPLLYVSPGQINLVAPTALSNLSGSSTTLVVFNGLLASQPIRVSVAGQAPGVFSVLGNAAGAGAVTHQDGSLVSRSAPLVPGEPISVYLTGMGPLSPPVPDGAPAPVNPLARALNNVQLILDGQPVQPLYAGAAPNFAGLQEVVALVPASLSHRFPQMSVIVQGAASNPFSAGGPTLYDVSPASVPPGADATVTLRGINLPSTSAVLAGGAPLPATLSQSDWQTLRVRIPARLLASGSLSLAVMDTAAPSEPPSNSISLSVQ